MPDRIPTFRPPWINRKPRRDAMRRNQSAAGYGRRAWRLARQERLLLDNYQCQVCRRIVPGGRELHVDHIVPKSADGSDLMENLITLCRSCHSKKTVAEEQGGRVGGVGGWKTSVGDAQSRRNQQACAAGAASMKRCPSGRVADVGGG